MGGSSAGSGSAARNAAILARLDAGATIQAIAEEFGITRQRVSQIAFRVMLLHEDHTDRRADR